MDAVALIDDVFILSIFNPTEQENRHLPQYFYQRMYGR